MYSLCANSRAIPPPSQQCYGAFTQVLQLRNRAINPMIVMQAPDGVPCLLAWKECTATPGQLHVCRTKPHGSEPSSSVSSPEPGFEPPFH